MIKEVFLTKTPASLDERWKSELEQGLILKPDYDHKPEGFFLDCGVHQINNESFYISIQVIW